MSKIMYNGQEYSSGVNYGSVLPMSPSDSTKVDVAINSKADASTTYTKTEVDNLLPVWIKQTPGTSESLMIPIVFYYYYADQWQAYVPFPFITKNDNYTISISSCVAENVGEIKSKLSILTKNANLFKIQTTKTMSSLPNMYSVCVATIIFTITFA